MDFSSLNIPNLISPKIQWYIFFPFQWSIKLWTLWTREPWDLITIIGQLVFMLETTTLQTIHMILNTADYSFFWICQLPNGSRCIRWYVFLYLFSFNVVFNLSYWVSHSFSDIRMNNISNEYLATVLPELYVDVISCMSFNLNRKNLLASSRGSTILPLNSLFFNICESNLKFLYTV